METSGESTTSHYLMMYIWCFSIDFFKVKSAGQHYTHILNAIFISSNIPMYSIVSTLDLVVVCSKETKRCDA